MRFPWVSRRTRPTQQAICSRAGAHQASRTTNTWDFENRLTQVALPSGIVDTFTYNGDGQRVQKIDSTGTTKHVWDGQNILLETDGSNIIQVVYTLQPQLYGNLISQWRSGMARSTCSMGLVRRHNSRTARGP